MAADPRLLFVDACVLAAPVTRTILIVGADHSGLRTIWSELVEREANRNLGRGALSVTTVRTRYLDRVLGPTGANPGRFTATSDKDRQVLADAEAAEAGFVITDNVRDFDEGDLTAARVAAVTPDLFMATRYSEGVYLAALTQLVSNMKNPPRGTAEMHSLIARRHPHLFSRFSDLFDVEHTPSSHSKPRTLYRGARCLLCGRSLSSPTNLRYGLGPECRIEV